MQRGLLARPTVTPSKHAAATVRARATGQSDQLTVPDYICKLHKLRTERKKKVVAQQAVSTIDAARVGGPT